MPHDIWAESIFRTIRRSDRADAVFFVMHSTSRTLRYQGKKEKQLSRIHLISYRLGDIDLYLERSTHFWGDTLSGVIRNSLSATSTSDANENQDLSCNIDSSMVLSSFPLLEQCIKVVLSSFSWKMQQEFTTMARRYCSLKFRRRIKEYFAKVTVTSTDECLRHVYSSHGMKQRDQKRCLQNLWGWQNTYYFRQNVSIEENHHVLICTIPLDFRAQHTSTLQIIPGRSKWYHLERIGWIF